MHSLFFILHHYIFDGELNKLAAPKAEHPSTNRTASKDCFAALPHNSSIDHRWRYPLHPQAHRYQGRGNIHHIQIITRIKQIDVFYAKSALDERAKYIYATRSILAKILQQHN